MGRNAQEPRADRIAIGGGGLDDEMFLAMAHNLRLGQIDQVHPGTGWVRGDGLVAEIKAKPAGPRMAHHARQEERRPA